MLLIYSAKMIPNNLLCTKSTVSITFKGGGGGGGGGGGISRYI